LRTLAAASAFAALLFLAFASAHLASAAVSTVTLSYNVVGDGTSQYPRLQYVYEGQHNSVNLTAVPKPYVMDAGTEWEVSQSIPRSNDTLRWEINGTNIGIAGGQTVVLRYYKQYFVTFEVSTSGPTRSFDYPRVNYTSFGNKTSVLAGSSVWADFNTNYTYRGVSTHLPLTRWYCPTSSCNNVVNGTLLIKPRYIEQFLVSLNLNSIGPDRLTSTSLVVTGPLGGAQLNQSLSAPGETLWLDYNSSLAFQNVVYSQSGQSRMALHYVSTTIATAPSNVTATYVEQYPLSVSFGVAGGTAPSGPVLNATSNGQGISLELFPGSAPSWLDAGSAYSVSSQLVGSTADERWATSTANGGVMNGPIALNLEYFHQVRIAYSYSVMGGGSINPSNVFYYYFGAQTFSPLSTSQNQIWADAGSILDVQGTFTGQSLQERWQLGSSPSTVLTSPSLLSFVYYHQVELQIAYTIPPGGLPRPPVLTGSELGSPFTSSLLSGNTIWLDSGTPWSVSEYLQSGITGERWAATGGENGTVGQAASIQLSYVHEYYVSVSANSQAGGVTSQSEWVPNGGSLQVSATPNVNWALAGWLGGGQGSYSGRNVSAMVVVVAPLTETAEFDLGFVVHISGGGSATVSFGTSSYTVGGNPLTFYVAPGTSVALTARPGPFESFAGWRGVSAGNAGAVVIVPSSPVSVTAVFVVNGVLAYGFVVLYWGVAVFAIAYLVRSGRISLSRIRIAGCWGAGPD